MSNGLPRLSADRSPCPSGSSTSLDAARRRWVATLVRRHGVPAADVEDVTQNVLLAIHRAAPIVVPEGRSLEEAWRAWCRGVVRRQVARHRRELWRSLPGEVDPSVSFDAEASQAAIGVDPSGALELEPSAPAPLDPEELLIASQETARARLALEELRAKKADRHAVLVAYEIDERSISEIAASLGITVNTCWNKLRLAREDLRAVWKRHRVTSGRRAGPGAAAPGPSLTRPTPDRSPRSSGTEGAGGRAE